MWIEAARIVAGPRASREAEVPGIDGKADHGFNAAKCALDRSLTGRSAHAEDRCCGGGGCVNPTFCFTSQGERPGYRMGLYNDINWCMANETKGYHCTVAVVVGLA